MEGGAPKGRRLDGGKRYFRITVFPDGEDSETRIPLFSHCQNKYTHMWENNTDGQSLPRVGKVANGASRIGFWRYEKSKGSLFSGEKVLQFLRQPKFFRGVVQHLYQQALLRRISPLRLPPAERADDPPAPLYARRSSGGAPAGSHPPAAPARCSG